MASPRRRSSELQAVVDTFFDRQVVIDAVGRDKVKALTRAGALVRSIARRLIRPARRISLSEMTEEQRDRWKAELRRARRRGRPRPRRPFASAEKGKPPRNKTGTLKENIYFGHDARQGGMYVGSIRIGGARTADKLEHGGEAVLKGSDGKRHKMTFQGNPFMQPALEQAAPKIPPMFRDIIKPNAIQLRGSR